ncbi:myosin heavy chain, clone 203-like [Palaemon carinicauda]|uniref:myosin heavy chain, clone 203-like n=1 Tax=Palaemon carinicauda TaxID=392227 RepID=UPI0035B5E3AC
METLQKDQEMEIEHFSSKLQDLQLTNERPKSELSNKKITIMDDLDKLTEKDQKILGLTQQLEKVQEENEVRIKREDKLEEEIEELKAETQGLSNRIETLQKEKEIEIEKFSTKLLSEMGQINLEMSEQLERAKNEKVTFIHQLESVFEEETEELEQTIEKQLGVMGECYPFGILVVFL